MALQSRGAKRATKKAALTPCYCEIPRCGYSKIYQRHRIVPGRDGGKYRSGNVIALCPTHHGEADRGWIPIEDLLEIVRLRRERHVSTLTESDA